MEFSYDNSDANPRNPSHPPRRVRFGQQSSDEMGELWIQVLTRMNQARSRRRKSSKPQGKLELGEGRCSGRISVGLALSATAAGIATAILIGADGPKGLDGQVARQTETLTFNKDIAPIVLDHCALCHRPGQSAPFSLLTYEEVKKHAKQIAEVTARRYMPPWLPEPGYGKFTAERRLRAEQIQLIQQWVAEGAREGKPSDLPAQPTWVGDWQLGRPDLVVEMSKPYTLPAEGRDLYRNFAATQVCGSPSGT